jgi:hypothetical protein
MFAGIIKCTSIGGHTFSLTPAIEREPKNAKERDIWVKK